MSETLLPRESGEFIAGSAENVKINLTGVKNVAAKIVKALESGDLSLLGFSQCPVHPKIANEEAINWIFLVDSLNFCFWRPDAKQWTVTWRENTYSGYFGLCAAINRALDEGYSITDPKYYSQMSLRDLKEILRGNDDLIALPLLNERLDCLHEVGLTLLEKFEGKFSNCVRSSNGSAMKLLQIIVENFPCFKDEAIYKGKRIAFYKRAQILIGDIWACFEGRNEGHFHDIDKLTMFADYRVPQALVYLEVLEYSQELMNKLKNGTHLDSGSEEEIEIRGCTVHAVELINREVQKVLSKEKGEHEKGSVICNSVLIDHYLWLYRRQNANQIVDVPFHKTISIYY